MRPTGRRHRSITDGQCLRSESQQQPLLTPFLEFPSSHAAPTPTDLDESMCRRRSASRRKEKCVRLCCFSSLAAQDKRVGWVFQWGPGYGRDLVRPFKKVERNGPGEVSQLVTLCTVPCSLAPDDGRAGHRRTLHLHALPPCRVSSSSSAPCCSDPDGTTNFAHGYPSFGVSVGVLFRGKPAAASVVEFVGGPMCWNVRTFSASACGGAYCNGQKINVSQTDQVERSLLVTGFGYEHDDAWATNMNLFKEFTDISRGVRRLGAAAVDMCHVAFGIVESYWEYRLKPWDMAAGVLVFCSIVEEAGGAVNSNGWWKIQSLIDLVWCPMV